MQIKYLVATNNFVKAFIESFCSEERKLIENIHCDLGNYVRNGTDVDEVISDNTQSMVYIYWSDLNDFARATSWAVEEVVQQGFVCLDSNYSYFNHLQTAHQYYLNQMFTEDRTEIITALFLLYLRDETGHDSPVFTKEDFESFLEYHDMGDVVGFDEFEELQEEFYEELQENSEEDDTEE